MTCKTKHQENAVSFDQTKAQTCKPETGKALAPDVGERIKNHPCYSEQAHHHYARMHLAVAPACNIQCNYCNRKYDCSNESRPGVVSEKLTPEEALHKVNIVADKLQNLSVVGIAGPGDPLANAEKTFRTFNLIAKQHPDLKLCLSTNGLQLSKHINTIKSLNIDHVTITMNTTDPEIGKHIYSWVFYNHKRYVGTEAAKILIDQQMEGLAALTAAGILCKVNSVLIPGINDHNLPNLHEAITKLGALIHNVMPLISAKEHGTHFGLTGQRGPTAAELKHVQDRLTGGIKMMRHCRQCRADAVGLLGEDRNAEFTKDKIQDSETVDVQASAESRQQYRQTVDHHSTNKVTASAPPIHARKASTVRMLAAVASKGQGLINEHFGHAQEFMIYEVSQSGALFVGHRRVNTYCQDGFGDETNLSGAIRAIEDCHAVFVSKIGSCPRSELDRAGIKVVDSYSYEEIESSLVKYFSTYEAELVVERAVQIIKGDATIEAQSISESFAAKSEYANHI